MKIAELSGVKEIARRANVSIATVDRVLHSRPGVAQRTKDKILEIIKEMDYKPNILAKRLASKRVFKFGILVPEVKGASYWRAPVLGIETAHAEFGEFGVELNYYFYDKDDRGSFVKCYQEIFEKPIDGIIAAPVFLKESMDFAIHCLERRVQYVFIDTNVPMAKPLSYIGPDFYQSGRVVGHICSYLMLPGEEVLAITQINNPDSSVHFKLRLEGFTEFFQGHEPIRKINTLELEHMDEFTLRKGLKKALKNQSIKIIYVTNSKTHLVAQIIKEFEIEGIILIGFDYNEHNLAYLKDGDIDFLICQKPIEQGYRAFVALYEYFIAKKLVTKTQYMPIDIVTLENYRYYEF